MCICVWVQNNIEKKYEIKVQEEKRRRKQWLQRAVAAYRKENELNWILHTIHM